MIEYPCPECGFDGPHPIVYTNDDGIKVVECNYCLNEFYVKPDEYENQM